MFTTTPSITSDAAGMWQQAMNAASAGQPVTALAAITRIDPWQALTSRLADLGTTPADVLALLMNHGGRERAA
jgi:hypothetical protein